MWESPAGVRAMLRSERRLWNALVRHAITLWSPRHDAKLYIRECTAVDALHPCVKVIAVARATCAFTSNVPCEFDDITAAVVCALLHLVDDLVDCEIKSDELGSFFATRIGGSVVDQPASLYAGAQWHGETVHWRRLLLDAADEVVVGVQSAPLAAHLAADSRDRSAWCCLAAHYRACITGAAQVQPSAANAPATTYDGLLACARAASALDAYLTDGPAAFMNAVVSPGSLSSRGLRNPYDPIFCGSWPLAGGVTPSEASDARPNDLLELLQIVGSPVPTVHSQRATPPDDGAVPTSPSFSVADSTAFVVPPRLDAPSPQASSPSRIRPAMKHASSPPRLPSVTTDDDMGDRECDDDMGDRECDDDLGDLHSEGAVALDRVEIASVAFSDLECESDDDEHIAPDRRPLRRRPVRVHEDGDVGHQQDRRDRGQHSAAPRAEPRAGPHPGPDNRLPLSATSERVAEDCDSSAFLDVFAFADEAIESTVLRFRPRSAPRRPRKSLTPKRVAAAVAESARRREKRIPPKPPVRQQSVDAKLKTVNVKLPSWLVPSATGGRAKPRRLYGKARNHLSATNLYLLDLLEDRM